MLLVAAACSAPSGESSEVGEQDQAVTGDDGPSIKERWCNSYTSERFCPKNVCVWQTRSDGTSYCGLPATE